MSWQSLTECMHYYYTFQDKMLKFQNKGTNKVPKLCRLSCVPFERQSSR